MKKLEGYDAKRLLLCALLISEINYVYSVDYSKLDCDGEPHTMFQYPKDGPSDDCKEYRERLITEKDKNLIVDAHNKWRNLVAGGKEKRGLPGPQPPAANMLVLDWDEEIANIAQRWAYQCKFQHDNCRRVEGSSVGQNIALHQYSDKFRTDFEKDIKGWYDEVQSVDRAIVKNYRRSTSAMIGHYTQLVSARSGYVGCGHVFYKADEDTPYTSLLVCNYKPAGNVLERPLYEKGKPASHCPKGTKRSKVWENLCSTGRRRYVLHYALLVSGITNVYSVDYCTLNCNGEQHTMCLYPKDGPSDACTDYKARLISEKDKNNIVDWHNKLRNKVAGGNEQLGAPGPQPPAANMMELDWDDEIATIAQRWAYQCQFQHDKCRRVEDSSVGQNIAVRQRSDKYASNFEADIQGWYDEVNLVDPAIVSSFGETGAMIGHYTQLVSAKTGYVGCGHVFYNDGSPIPFRSLLVCNYKPAGNVLTQPIYEKGKGASDCPEGTKRSNAWKNLCSTGKNKYGRGGGGTTVELRHWIILTVTLFFSVLKL